MLGNARAGHIAALEKGKSAERYILGGENLTLKQILDKLGVICGLALAESEAALLCCLRGGRRG